MVEPGVINLDVTAAAAPHGLYYAPDPSSQSVCTIGGNVAFNSGGAHCFRHGMTANHVLGLEVVLPDGEVVRLGGDSLEQAGPDLTGLFVGSEGLFGVALEITLRLIPRPEAYRTVLAAYDSLQAAGDAVSRIIAAGLLPGAMEIMDRLAIDAAEAAVARRLSAATPPRCCSSSSKASARRSTRSSRAADGDASTASGADQHARGRRTPRSGRASGRAASARSRRSAGSARTSSSRTAWCRARGSARRSSPSSSCRAQHGIRVANVFHAGDGNLHPLILYDGREAGALERAEALAADILRLCIRLGGSITGEHGVGLEKRAFLPRDVRRRGHRVHAAPAPVDRSAASSPTAARCWSRRRMPAMTLALHPLEPSWSDRAVATSLGHRRPLRDPRRRHARRRGPPGRRGTTLRPRASWPASSTYTPDECVFTALAGTRVADIERVLGRARPVPAVRSAARSSAGATIGGTVAAGLSGPGRYRYGGIRDFVIGARVVDGEGRLDPQRRQGREERRRLPAAPRDGGQWRPLRRHRRDVRSRCSPARGAGPRCGSCAIDLARGARRSRAAARRCPTWRRSTSTRPARTRVGPGGAAARSSAAGAALRGSATP